MILQKYTHGLSIAPLVASSMSKLFVRSTANGRLARCTSQKTAPYNNQLPKENMKKTFKKVEIFVHEGGGVYLQDAEHQLYQIESNDISVGGLSGVTATRIHLTAED